jgi:hypothetical protein
MIAVEQNSLAGSPFRHCTINAANQNFANPENAMRRSPVDNGERVDCAKLLHITKRPIKHY